jgi:hypothetical protein
MSCATPASRSSFPIGGGNIRKPGIMASRKKKYPVQVNPIAVGNRSLRSCRADDIWSPMQRKIVGRILNVEETPALKSAFGCSRAGMRGHVR